MSNRVKKHRIYPHFEKGRFYNYIGEKKPQFLLPSLGMFLEWYLFKNHEKKADTKEWLNSEMPVKRSDNLAITWIGHSTFLIQISNINIITDPIFGDLSFLFPRILPPGIELKNLPEIDFVLISHNHRDHMDALTLKFLKQQKNICFLVPKGDKNWFKSRGFENVIEKTWWDSHIFKIGSKSIDFMFLPAFHWSQRGFFDYNKSLWGGWMITAKNLNIYFAGDTGYHSHFNSISQEFPVIDLAMLPIGPCEPRQWMKESHMCPEEAVEAFKNINAKYMIPMHWGTYYFGVDRFTLPYERLVNYWNQQPLSAYQLIVPKIGERTIFTPEKFIIPAAQSLDLRLTL